MSRTQTTPNPRRAAPPVVGMSAIESFKPAPDGTVHWGVDVHGTPTTAPDFDRFEVYAQVSGADADDWHMIGWGRTLPVHCEHPFLAQKGETFKIALATMSILGGTVGPEGSPQVTLTLQGAGLLPADVTGFTAAADQGGVRFAWTAVNDNNNPDVMGYEIRAGATGWQSATFVAVVAPRKATWAWVPRSQAPGTAFYIKAVTNLGDYSAAVGSATLSAAGATCLDSDSMVGYQEVTIAGGAATVTVTTKCPYTAAPYITVTGSVGTGRVLAFNTSGYAVNGDGTYSFTLRASARAPAAGSWTVHVHEAGG